MYTHNIEVIDFSENELFTLTLLTDADTLEGAESAIHRAIETELEARGLEDLYIDFDGTIYEADSKTELYKVYKVRTAEEEQSREDCTEDAYRAWRKGTGNTAYQDFLDDYRGDFSSWAHCAEEFLEDCGELESVPEALRYCIDFEKFAAHNLICDGWWEVDGHYFSA